MSAVVTIVPGFSFLRHNLGECCIRKSMVILSGANFNKHSIFAIKTLFTKQKRYSTIELLSERE